MIEPDVHKSYYTFGLESKHMEQTNFNEEIVRKTVAFHGHMCPGLAIGIRAAEVALKEIGPHAHDEEVVAVDPGGLVDRRPRRPAAAARQHCQSTPNINTYHYQNHQCHMTSVLLHS